ncbi:hypothetical protein [Actinomadura sp. 9N215]|uniref:hypothetical protein n=1 Tax=Actinomadura sp. 9N215 TaxID=3375150 RepID=UPI0037ABBA3A
MDDDALMPTPTSRDGKGPAKRRNGIKQLPNIALEADSASTDAQFLPTPLATDGTHGSPNQRSSGGAFMLPSLLANLDDVTPAGTGLLPTPMADDANHHTITQARLDAGRQKQLYTVLTGPNSVTPVNWGRYAPAIARWEQIHGPAPAPTEPGRDGKARLSPAFSEWMMGLPVGHVTSVPGLSRNAQLTAIGNGVVPQQAAHALRLMLRAVNPVAFTPSTEPRKDNPA